jgi:hypothetical protein
MNDKPQKPGKELNLYKQTLFLTDKQHQIVRGTLLGDLYISPTGKNSRLCFTQKNKDYLFHLYENFKEWTLSNPKELIQKPLSSTGQWRLAYRFATFNHSEFQTYREKFYPEGKKILTKESIDYLLSDPAVLAYWFMDDGSKQSYGYYLHTGGFTEEENDLLAEALLEKFDLRVTVTKKNARNYQCLYIPAGSKQRFKALIEPYIVPTMLYKL